ncbi:hypothetical protein Afil01_41590 [Actinorhabdospora filicis]|uniref:ARB-07466-like C-terminal domain-containing protein n=1 Tax=Actinorhabdospora filicis TaxID=1785913 RepID=A0A9W6SP74_9ACTN|nr:hypothetical protein [Actinorhabdospora filicis]GLZ79352.1 hypothetical protein Afil01_41590 [Actinorhabdospora filicis]
MRAKHVLTALLAVAAVAGGGYVVARIMDAEIPNPFQAASCTMTGADQSTLRVDLTQASNAATITAVATAMDMPDRAVVVALATAFQESRLENIEHGDRDSLGLFQQRPSQGWGTPEQIQDPRYATKKFFQALKKVEDWEDMRVTDAAQAVQRSAYPDAYEQWADEAQTLTDALRGQVDAAVACRVKQNDLTGPAAVAAVTGALDLDWSELDVETDGTTIRVDGAHGWQTAHWLVAHAGDLGVSRVVYAGREWTASSGEWNEAEGEDATDKVVIAAVGEAA